MLDQHLHNPSRETVAHALIDADGYAKMYAASVADPDTFWGEQAKSLDWITPPTRIKNTSFAYPDVSIKWFEDGVLNVSANCIDRHLATRAEQTAILWQSDDPDVSEAITYRQLHEEVCRFANVLLELGVTKGDRVVLYLPMIPQAAYAMLACARIGAIHSIVFAGFSPDALANRINDCNARLVITADEAPRGGRVTALKTNVNKALLHCPHVDHCLVVRRTGGEVAWEEGRDHWLHELAANVSPDCSPAPIGAEDPLFILYTSGSTGKPKGALHTTGGYLLYAALTHKYVFDYHEGDIYWCTADVGWVTGHSYIVYGPLANGATTLMFEGVPTWPDAGRFWQICAQHKVNIFYTAPTAIRALMGQGREWVDKHDLSSLRILGIGRRADQPRGLELVRRGGRPRPLPDRRHLVADRDRRHPDHPAARRHPDQARLGNQALLRRPARRPRPAVRRRADRVRLRSLRRSRDQGQLARPDAHHIRRPRPLR